MAARKLRKRGERWQADFRAFARWGGGRETLRFARERYGVASQRDAERLYDLRLAELLQARAKEQPDDRTGAPATIRGGDLRTLRGLLDAYIDFTIR